MMILIEVATVLSFLSGPTLNILGMITLVPLAIYAGTKPKSIFSIRTVGDRKLVFTQDELTWGTWLIPMHEVEKLEVYIHAFETFKHHMPRVPRRKVLTVEYGDRNKLQFFTEALLMI